jgi:MscS family membrane protein
MTFKDIPEPTKFALNSSVSHHSSLYSSAAKPTKRPAYNKTSGQKASVWILRGLVVLVLNLFAMQASFAISPIDTGVGGSSESEESADTKDPFGRDTPRHTVQGFISALAANDTLLASNYLNLSKSDNPTTAVRQLKQALDAGGRFQQELQINNTPEGSLNDQLPPSQEKVGSINVADKSVNLILERVVANSGDQYWQFSAETIKAVPDVLENVEPTLVNRYTVDFLNDKKLFGYDISHMTAVVLIALVTFILAYLLVWLLYHLTNFLYPKLRNKPLPLTDNVILPMAVVIMASLLSEIMVYAGVSVTVREPVNRLTDIASWLAMTWLLLRVIDAVFKRAEHLSYKKNYTERVSILGLLRKLTKALLLIFAVIVIFGNLGFDLTTGIAALGVGGLALALGAQKTIENLVGSVVVVADSPVRVGDYCKFGTYEGTVIDIGIRSSRVRTLSRTIVTIPNGDFSSMQIENFTSRDMFRFLHNIYLKRSADIETIFKLTQHLNECLGEHELTNQEWNQARIAELRQDCYVVELQAYVNASGAAEFYDKQNILFTDLLKEVNKFDVEHALPTQQLIVHQDDLSETSAAKKHKPVDMQKQAESELADHSSQDNEFKKNN